MYSYMQYGCINLTLIKLKVQFITFINSAQATALFFLIHTLDPLLKQGADKNKTFF